MVFSFGLLWTILAATVAPSAMLAALYVSSHLVFRSAVTDNTELIPYLFSNAPPDR